MAAQLARLRRRVTGETGLVEVSPSEDRLEFDWLDLSDWSVLDLKWRSSTREEQEVVEPDLSLEVVASLGEDLVVTACTQRS